MKLIVTGGGTGGHIYPALSVYHRFLTEFEDSEALYVGSKYGIEHDVVSHSDINYKEIKVRGFERSDKLYSFVSFFYFILSIFQAFFLVLRYKPDLVIGMGGYVSAPVVFAAWLLRVPTMVHEQNAVSGLTTKFLVRFATKILYSFERTREEFSKYSHKLVFTGNPVRTEFLTVSREEERRNLGLAEDDVLILSFGGSGGSRTINDLAFALIPLLKEEKRLRLIHITGKNFEGVYDEKIPALDAPENFILLSYSHEMHKLFAASDILIGRAGAITMAEMEALRLPAVLIPSPYVAHNHQVLNAREKAASGGCIMIEEDELNEGEFVDLIRELALHPERRAEMKAAYPIGLRDEAMLKIMSLIEEYKRA